MMKIKGLNRVRRTIVGLKEQVESLKGNDHHIPLDQLLTPRFMQTHTDCDTAEEWFAASPLAGRSHADAQAILEGKELSEYVRATTNYLTWDEMLSAAGRDYLEARLKLE